MKIDKKLITLGELNNSELNESLKISDLENMFNIFQDKRGNLVFDLNQTLYININKSNLPIFTCDHQMQWPLISYKIYGTTRLAWLLWKLNNINPNNIFETRQPGDKILYLPTEYVENVVSQITNFN